MAGFKLGSLLLTLAMIMALLSGYQAYVSPCGGDVTQLIKTCEDFLQIPGEKKDPSRECCDVIRQADLPCVCQSIPPGAKKHISPEKVAYVFNKCNRPIESGTKCGNFTIPLV